MSWKNAITDILKVQIPIIQAPMLGVSTPAMAAAVSNEGGLGSLAVGGLSPETTRELIHKTKELTNKPFAVNLFAHSISGYVDDDIAPMRQFLLDLSSKRNYHLDPADLSGFKLYTYHDQLDILLEEDISNISFTFGCLDRKTIALLKERGCTLNGTATCTAEALILEEEKIDLITVQGIEAGGHRGTFIENIPLPQVGLFSLLPQVIKAVHIPVIAAGGINNAQSIRAAFTLGAAAVQIGTAFIDTVESEAVPSYKAKLEMAADTDTTLTRAFSGRWARGIRNEIMHEIEQSGIAIPPYPLQNSLTTKLRKLAQQNNDAGYTTLWAGQAGTSTVLKSSSEIFHELVTQYETLYKL